MKLRSAFVGVLVSVALLSTGANADGTAPAHGSLKDEVGSALLMDRLLRRRSRKLWLG